MLTVTDREGRDYLITSDTPGKILLVRNGRLTRVFAVSIEQWGDEGFVYSRINPARYAQLEHDLHSVIDRFRSVISNRQLVPGVISILFDFNHHISILGYNDVSSVNFFF